jgi:GGDEF domain-containing protein
MPLQGTFVVIADGPAEDVVTGLRAAGGFPVIESNWSDAPNALASAEPEAIVLADACPNERFAFAFSRALTELRKRGGGTFTPIIARCRDDHPLTPADALAIASTAPVERIVRRLASVLRVRALHGTVLRRTNTLASRGLLPPELKPVDPLDDATVLLIGRGRSLPELSVALGEQIGVIGALSVERAARTLNARDVDGIVIGDGFNPKVVEALLTVLADDVRFRDLPVAVLGGPAHIVEPYCLDLPNLERTNDGVARLVERFLPFVRMHALGQRLRRMLASLDAKGMIDPDTGLLAQEAFWRDLNRAVDEAEKRGVGLSIARFSFERSDRRTSVDAARLVARLVRQVDFACREADNSIFAVFTETDLRSAHIIARRIAGVLKNTMLAPEPQRSGNQHAGISTDVTLATLKPSDSVDSLIARVVGADTGR